MGSSNIRDVLTSFSPNLDLFAISLGDGRIKVRYFPASLFCLIAKNGRTTVYESGCSVP